MTFKVFGLRELEKSYASAAAAMGRAEARAVRRVGGTIVTRQIRALAATINLRVSVIRKELVIKEQPTTATPRVVFTMKERRIPLNEFIGTRYSGRKSPGAVVKKFRNAPAEVYSADRAKGTKKDGGAFAIKGRGVKGGIFQRLKKYHAGSNRQVVTRPLGPSVLSIYIQDGIQKVGVDAWNERLPIELDRESAFALKQAGLI